MKSARNVFSISVTTIQNKLQVNVETLMDYLKSLDNITSNDQYEMALDLLMKLNEWLPTGPCDQIQLMECQSSIKLTCYQEFALESYQIVLLEIITKIGAGFLSADSMPKEVKSLFSITDDVAFIFEAIQILCDTQLLTKYPTFMRCLLEELLFDENYLMFVFVKMASVHSSDENKVKSQQLLQQLISLPDKIANEQKQTKTATATTIFQPHIYSTILITNVLKAFYVQCHINDVEKVVLYDVEFLAKLLSKIVVNFNCDRSSPAIKYMLVILSEWAGNEKYKDQIRSLMRQLSERAVEVIALMVLKQEKNKKRLCALFGDLIECQHWKYVFTKKIPFSSTAQGDETVDNLVYYLAVTSDTPGASSGNILESVLTELMSVWSMRYHIIGTSFDNHFHITKYVVLMAKYLFNLQHHPVKEDFVKNIVLTLFGGSQIHMESTDIKLRYLGMITAEILMEIFHPTVNNEEKLRFDYEHDADVQDNIVKVLVALQERCFFKAGVREEVEELGGENVIIEMMEQLFKIIKDDEVKVEALIKTKKTFAITKKDTKERASGPQLKQEIMELDSDDDEDLQMYDEEETSRGTKQNQPPKYLLDLIQAFSINENLEDVEKFEMSMEASEGIIKSQLSQMHPDLAVDLLKLFLTLQKKCAMEDFERMKVNNLKTICLIYPKECAQYLCCEFNTETNKYSMSLRIDMLHLIAETAKALSRIEVTDEKVPDSKKNAVVAVGSVNKLLIKINEENEAKSRKSSDKIIRERLMAKTRQITTKTASMNSISHWNRFSNVAGWFFFPLINGFGRKLMVFTTSTSMKYDTDNILLVHFLETITIVMLCAENCPIAPKFAKEVFNLSVFLRFHQESKVRLKVLQMLASVFLTLTKDHLVREFSSELHELTEHLARITQNTVMSVEPDKSCVDFARQLMVLCQQTIY